MDEAARSDLLGVLSPPFRLVGAADFLPFRSVGGFAGISIAVQNPYQAWVMVTVRVREVSFDRPEGIDLYLPPLDVGWLLIPFRRKPGVDKLRIAIGGAAFEGSPPVEKIVPKPVVRARSLTPATLDRRESIIGIGTGLVQLVGLGMGRFSIARRGGVVDNPFTVEVTTNLPLLPSPEVDYERIWAAPGSEDPRFVVVRIEEATSGKNWLSRRLAKRSMLPDRAGEWGEVKTVS